MLLDPPLPLSQTVTPSRTPSGLLAPLERDVHYGRLHGYEALTLKKQEENCIQAFENKCIIHVRMMRIPCTKIMTIDQWAGLRARRCQKCVVELETRSCTKTRLLLIHHETTVGQY